MTETEKLVLELTAELWNAITCLGSFHPQELDDHCRDIHDIQHRIMARAARRSSPDFFNQF
jgi:hypothetical protein